MDITLLVPSIRKDKMEKMLRSLDKLDFYPEIFIYAQGYNNLKANKNTVIQYTEFKENKNIICNMYYNMIENINTKYVMLCDDDFIFYNGAEKTINQSIDIMDKNKNIGLVCLNNINQKIKYKHIPNDNEFNLLNESDIFRVRKNGGMIIRSKLISKFEETFESGEDVAYAINTFLSGYEVLSKHVNIFHDYSDDGIRKLINIYDRSKYYVEAVLVKRGIVRQDIKKKEYVFIQKEQ